MPTSVQSVIANHTADAVLDGFVEGVEVAAPVANKVAKRKAKKALRSRPAHLTGLIVGSLVFASSYGTMARRRRLKRIEQKLNLVVDEVETTND